MITLVRLMMFACLLTFLTGVCAGPAVTTPNTSKIPKSWTTASGTKLDVVLYRRAWSAADCKVTTPEGICLECFEYVSVYDCATNTMTADWSQSQIAALIIVEDETLHLDPTTDHRVGPPTLHQNCHSFTFGNGKYWVGDGNLFVQSRVKTNNIQDARVAVHYNAVHSSKATVRYETQTGCDGTPVDVPFAVYNGKWGTGSYFETGATTVANNYGAPTQLYK